MKKFPALLLAVVMFLGLTACGSKAEDAGITVNIIAAQYGTQTADWWKGFEEKFESANENIDLVIDVVSWADIYTVVNTRIANNKAPDLLNIDGFADYQADDLLLPASEWVSDETMAKFYDSFLEASVVDGTLWAVPDLASARVMYCNVDILNAAGVGVPTTWAELQDACVRIKAYDATIYPWGVDMTTDEGQASFAYYTWNNGGGFVDDGGNWTLNSAENVAAIEFVIDLINAGYTNTDPSTETRYTLQDLFAAGKIAMMIAPTQIEGVCAKAGNNVNYVSAAIPSNEGADSTAMGVMDRIMCFDNGHSEEKLAAITAVVDQFYDDRSYAEWVVMEGFLPATSTGAVACLQLQPDLKKWIDIVAGARFYPATKTQWMDVKQGVIDVQQKALQGGDVQALLDDLQKQIAG